MKHVLIIAAAILFLGLICLVVPAVQAWAKQEQPVGGELPDFCAPPATDSIP